MQKKQLKVLFVASSNSLNGDIAPFIKAQGDSLKALGTDVQYFRIEGKGVSGYLKAASSLRKYLKKNPVDIIHAHYTLSGWSAILSFPPCPVVLSLMGTDTYGQYIGVNKIKPSSRYLTFLTFLIQPFVRSIICKSRNIEKYVYLQNKVRVIPNGIILNEIHCHERGFREELGLDPGKKNVLFLGDKSNRRKNFALLQETMSCLNSEDIVLVDPYPITHEQVVKYLNSVDALVVPSLMEGSPNLVKEAMACNCPVVATKVGDIVWLFGDEPGHYLATFASADMAEKIKLALGYSARHGRTNGRGRIIELGLDAETVAKKIFAVYKEILP